MYMIIIIGIKIIILLEQLLLDELVYHIVLLELLQHIQLGLGHHDDVVVENSLCKIIE